MLFIYLFIWSTPPSSQQKAIIKGGKKIGKEWERIEELNETFLQYYIYVQVWEKKLKSMCTLLMLKKVCNVTCWREVSAGCSGNKSVPGSGCLKERWALEEGFVWALNKNGEGTCSRWLSPLARRYPRRKGSLKVPRMASEIRFADQCALGRTATSTKARQTCTSQKEFAR